jgi:hypothetical protein
MAETTPTNIPVYSREASRNFFLDTRSYTDFDTTRPDFRRMVGCTEPRNEDRGSKRIKTVIQGAGGGGGEGQDRAIVQTILSGQLVTWEQGFSEETQLRGGTVLGGHDRCKWAMSNAAVLREEAEPSDFTQDDFNRSLRIYGVEEDIRPLMPCIFEAVNLQLEYVEEEGSLEHMLEIMDAHYPIHSNVAGVIGENVAQIYIENHHPHAGLNRDKKAKQRDKGDDIQGYHESRRAAFADIRNGNFVSNAERGYRMGAFLLRNAAARTILGSLQPSTEFWDIELGERGLLFVEREGLRS